jgi:hypothetical protein
MKMLLMAIMVVMWVANGHSQQNTNESAGERIFVEGATINSRPVRLIFDTGAERSFLFEPAAARLGLKVSFVRNVWRQPLFPATERCRLDFRGVSRKERIVVFPRPAYLDEPTDGAVGWNAVADQILVFNTLSNTVQFVSSLPPEAANLTRFPIRIWSDTLVLKALDHGKTGFVSIDTGSDSGVGLAPRKWRERKDAHPTQSSTFKAFYMLTEGILVREQTWASRFDLGTLSLTDVVVEEADPVSVRELSRRHLATLGLAALKRLDLIIDGRHDVAYLRPRVTPPTPYEHNRAGAAFVPPDKKSEILIARVADNSPASEAGIRNGDILLSVNDQDLSNWRSKTNRLNRFWRAPAGTQLRLSLQRGTETFKTSLKLRDILAPATNSASAFGR